jgi:hypothetical protein
MEVAVARSERGKGKRYQDRDYGKTIKQKNNHIKQESITTTYKSY